MSSTLPALYETHDLVRSVDDLMKLSGFLVKSQLLPEAIRTPEAAAAIILKGRELGIGPMEAFSSINVIKGKPSVSPQLMIALASRSGQLSDFTVTDDGEKCTVTVYRKGRKPFTASFSMGDAQAMGLAGKNEWAKQPKVMRQWRAVSAAFRVVFADVLAGMYTPEEMGASVDAETGEILSEDQPAAAPVVYPIEPSNLVRELTEKPVEPLAPMTRDTSKGEDPGIASMQNLKPGPAVPSKTEAPKSEKPVTPLPTGKLIIQTKRFFDVLVSEAKIKGWACENGQVNSYRLLNGIKDGGFTEHEITDMNLNEALAAMRRHYQEQAELAKA